MRRPAGPLIAILVLVLLASGGIYLLYGYTIKGSCTVGVYGAAANITLSGFNAADSCDWLVATYPRQLYRQQGSPAGVELCAGKTAKGLEYVVRDSGLFMLIGSGLCREIAAGTLMLSPP